MQNQANKNATAETVARSSLSFTKEAAAVIRDDVAVRANALEQASHAVLFR